VTLAVILLGVGVLCLSARVEILNAQVKHLENCIRNGWRF